MNRVMAFLRKAPDALPVEKLVLIAACMLLAACFTPDPQKEQHVVARFNMIMIEALGGAPAFNESVMDDISFVRDNRYILAENFPRNAIDFVRRRLWFREAVYQLCVSVRGIEPDGRSGVGSPFAVVAALDSAQAYGSFIDIIVRESRIDAGRIVESLSKFREFHGDDALGRRLDSYVSELERIRDRALSRSAT